MHAAPRAHTDSMRIFVAGATGVIGMRLVPLLVAAGHDVAGMTRSPQKAHALRALGAKPVVCDVYDVPALVQAVDRFAPALVLNELTDLPDELEHLEGWRPANRRMRGEGTQNLLLAAGDAKTIAQSTAFPAGAEEHENLVLGADGVVLRYGLLYGPGTWHGDELPPPPRVHVDEAARRTLAALDARPGTIIDIVEASSASPEPR
jgi:NAD(P)-dependent dehydrogenase (short-subunit alcohol dehydrogenase family)